jgi:Uma2 family endonuclease
LRDWAKRDGTGRAFDSSPGFILEDGAKLSPAAAWVRLEKIRAVRENSGSNFSVSHPISPSKFFPQATAWNEAQEKCREYIANGTAEAWLIDPEHRTVRSLTHAQPQGREQTNIDSLASETLPGFIIDLCPLWQGLDILIQTNPGAL